MSVECANDHVRSDCHEKVDETLSTVSELVEDWAMALMKAESSASYRSRDRERRARPLRMPSEPRP